MKGCVHVFRGERGRHLWYIIIVIIIIYSNYFPIDQDMGAKQIHCQLRKSTNKKAKREGKFQKIKEKNDWNHLEKKNIRDPTFILGMDDSNRSNQKYACNSRPTTKILSIPQRER